MKGLCIFCGVGIPELFVNPFGKPMFGRRRTAAAEDAEPLHLVRRVAATVCGVASGMPVAGHGRRSMTRPLETGANPDDRRPGPVSSTLAPRSEHLDADSNRQDDGSRYCD